ncbi:hypothetical protein [Streptomyces lydicamycinicus]|uniref:Permease n=1 Tax=Streptomyces lydicamycinicus TaxID=1546107 RepID=A0A0P4R3N0_9ACTN|nr:hypothetical protein [Streptomyces lydicamycinicus]GAO07433.1 hypothetical protein TPA0598_02_06730 [Streptomyces lydicamycinicus]
MRQPSLSWQLLRMGWASQLRAGGGHVRAVALLLATAVLALGLTSMIAVHATYEGIELRSASRALQFKDAFPDRPPVALGKNDFDEMQGRQFSLIYLRPLTKNMPLPPGVDRWPAPGEALLSPGLVQALGSEGAVDRYGKLVGTIRDEGLASPGERYGYVNPTDQQLDRKAALSIVGFGEEKGMKTGDPLFISDEGKFLTALYLILLPAGALAVIATRMGSTGRDKRTALVSALGGGRRHRVLLNVGESATPILIGAVLGTLPGLCVMAAGNLRLPWINYFVSSVDLQRWWWAFPMAGCVAAVALLLLVCALHRTGRRRRTRSTRLAAHKGQIVRWAALACPLVVIATVWGPAQLDPAQYSDLRMKLYNGGVVAALATLPCAVAVGAAALGTRLAHSSRRTGSAGALIAGRHSAAHPGVVARLVAGVGIVLVVVSQVQLKNSQFGESARAAQAAVNRVGSSMLLMHVDTQSLARQQLNPVLQRLPQGTEMIALYPPAESASGATVRLQGSCQALRAVKLSCSREPITAAVNSADLRITEAIRWTSPDSDRLAVRQGAVLPASMGSAPRTVVLASSDGKKLPEAQINQLLRDALPLAAVTVESPGGSWLVGANNSVAHGRWVIFFGLPGVLIVALAIVLANLAEFLRFSRMVAPLSVLTGERKIYYSTAMWALLVPLLATIATSVIVASWLAVPQVSAANGVELSNGMLTATAGALAVLAVLTWWWGSRAAQHQSSLWRPLGE